MIRLNPVRFLAVGMALVFAAALDILYQRLDRVQLAEEAEAALPIEPDDDRRHL